ncbi:hypothetical protein [Carnimonas bestiolae]|uniref:hypothetical protein n=1 Tax=Carnimonas bestiolae TaxID=3402172 RepID=UPI003EDB8AD4
MSHEKLLPRSSLAMDISRKARDLDVFQGKYNDAWITISLTLVSELLQLSTDVTRPWPDRLDGFLIHMRSALSNIPDDFDSCELALTGTLARASVMRKRRLVVRVEQQRFLNRNAIKFTLTEVTRLA